jgi:hypothetical protein
MKKILNMNLMNNRFKLLLRKNWLRKKKKPGKNT